MSLLWIVLFDWDGTLIDSLPTKVRNASRLFHQEFGISLEDVTRAYRRASGIPRKELFVSICTDNGLAPLDDEHYERLSQRFTEMNLASLTNPNAHGIVAQETIDTLKALRASGYPMYVSSSADPLEISKGAASLGLDCYFTEIMGSLPGFGKGPQHVAHVLEAQSVGREQLVFVGDELADISLGRLAGIRTVAKVGTCTAEFLRKENPDHIINKLSELPALLDNLGVESYENNHR
jgi:phosphoglycolate phosphatase-like HAD superfamily hydrolase